MATWTPAPIPSRINSTRGLVWPVISLVVGGALLVFGLAQAGTVHAARSWPTINGQLDTWAIATRVSHSRRGSSTSYAVDAKYHFMVDGKEYTGNRFHITNDSFWFRSSAEAVWLKNKVGGDCEVHYDPDNPSNCCLDPSAGSQTWWLFGVGIVLCVAGSTIFYPNRR